jgi:hypothetical protein
MGMVLLFLLLAAFVAFLCLADTATVQLYFIASWIFVLVVGSITPLLR